ncbi:hypothetical protein [Nocardiopsis dassonvillei]|uniref:hypothetical protein n=1 Tax=Nocardiopsis dassonvillei TaxID=2014 RepID=UPI00362DBFCB
MEQTTTIPALTQAVYDRLAASADERLTGVQLILGQPPNGHLEDDLIVVGWSPDRAITSTQTRQSLGAKRDREDYQLPLLVGSQSGDDSPQAVLARCGELVEAVHTEIASDRTFGGLVLHTGISQVSMDPVQTATGPSCTAEVVLQVAAVTRK